MESVDEAREELQEFVKHLFIKWSTRNLDTSIGFGIDDWQGYDFWKNAWELMTEDQKSDVTEHVQNTRKSETTDVRSSILATVEQPGASDSRCQHLCFLESLPQEIREIIMSLVIPEWNSGTFQLLFLSKALFPAVLRALCHSPPVLRICRDIHYLLNFLDRNPSLAPMVQHLRFAIHAEHNSPIEKLSFIRLLVTCSNLKVFSAFSDFVRFLDGVGSDSLVSSIWTTIPIQRLMIFDNGLYPTYDCLSCFSHSRYLRSLDILGVGWQERGWEEGEYLDLPSPIALQSSIYDDGYSPFFIFPPSLRAMRMQATGYTKTQLGMNLPALLRSRLKIKTPHTNLLKLRLLEVAVDDTLRPELLLELLRELAHSLEILRLARTFHSVACLNTIIGEDLSPSLYPTLNAISNLKILELQSFTLGVWDCESGVFGPFAPTLQRLTLNSCFGPFLDRHLWRFTFTKLPGNLRSLCLKGYYGSDCVAICHELMKVAEEQGIAVKWVFPNF
ncbi:hypothetical protein BT69DRAFT_1316887 [Atractiella rhizophila]|nr:hypothetical protein BT69DRAFT_1316887 [Atractiella rhizophila]